MKAVVFPAKESVAVQDVPDPTCADDEVIIKIAQTGICGTDVHIYRDEYKSDFPLIPGHEFSGTVVELGSQVAKNIAEGDRVAVDPNIYCTYCNMCRREQANQCENWQGVGVTRSGAFAEYVNVPARACYKLPDTITDREASFIEPLACVVHAMNRLELKPAQRILIIGAGPMGLLLLQTLRHGGAADITMVEKRQPRLDMADELGANHLVRADDQQTKNLKAISERGFDIVVDATGIPAVIQQSFQYLAPYGQFLQFGVTANDATIEISPYDIFNNDWTILGTFAIKYTFLQTIDMFSAGIINVDPLVSHEVPMHDFDSVFQEFAKGDTLKVHIQTD